MTEIFCLAGFFHVSFPRHMLPMNVSQKEQILRYCQVVEETLFLPNGTQSNFTSRHTFSRDRVESSE